MFTKRHYKAISETIKLSQNKKDLIYGLVLLFAEDNPRFNEKKFFKACGISEDFKGFKTPKEIVKEITFKDDIENKDDDKK